MMATLKFGKYTVQPDASGWMVLESKTRRTGNNAGEEYSTPAGYFARLPDALEKVLEYRLRDSDATDVRALADEVRAFRRDMEPVFSVGEVAP